MLVIICLNVAFIYVFKLYGPTIDKWIKVNIGFFINRAFPFDWLLVIAFIQLFLLFMVPGFHLFQTLLSFTIHRFWKSFFMIWVSHNVAATIVYLLATVVCKESINDRLKSSKYYKFVLFESKKKPIQTGLIMRQIGIPYPMKNALVALGGSGFGYYLLTLWPKISYSTAISAFFGVGLRNIGELYGTGA